MLLEAVTPPHSLPSPVPVWFHTVPTHGEIFTGCTEVMAGGRGVSSKAMEMVSGWKSTWCESHRKTISAAIAAYAELVESIWRRVLWGIPLYYFPKEQR